jgi:hypothetical protein
MIETQNISSLSGENVAMVRQALEGELARRHFRLSPAKSEPVGSSDSVARARLTFSENTIGYVWVAEIRTGDVRQTVMVFAPREERGLRERAKASLAMSRKTVWQQGAPILDFAFLPSETAEKSKFVVLLPEWLAFYTGGEGEWKLDRSFLIPHLKPWPRDLRGYISVADMKILLPGLECVGDFERPDSFRCSSGGSRASSTLASVASVDIEGHRGSDTVSLPLTCDDTSVVVTTGTGDWTQPDFLQGYKMVSDRAVAFGDPVAFPGPILALWSSPDGTSLRVVSRNLQTELYEASIVSVTCSE